MDIYNPKPKRPRCNKTIAQKAALEIEWAADERIYPERAWDIAKRTGLTQKQVYKWFFDRKRGIYASERVTQRMLHLLLQPQE
jgi:hypothetical protein